MKKILLSILFFISTLSFSHRIDVFATESKDEKGVIVIRGKTDNGTSAAGEMIYLLSDIAYDGDEDVFDKIGGEDYHGKLILFKGKLGKDETLVIPKPRIKRYVVVLYAGVGHTFSTKGIPLRKEEQENWEKMIEKYSSTLGEYKEKMKTKKFD